jgi:hypothetical protein
LKETWGGKFKTIGKILSIEEIPHNPTTTVSLVVSTRLIPYLKIPIGNKKMFKFDLEDVSMDKKEDSIVVPYDHYWQPHPDGTFILMGRKAEKTWHIVDSEIDRDLKKLAIDGFAARMASYSSVKPTWGHEDNVMAKETQGKFGFLDKFGRKSKNQEEEKE